MAKILFFHSPRREPSSRMLVHPVHPFNVRQTNLQAIGGRYQRSSRFLYPTSALTLKNAKTEIPSPGLWPFAAAYDLSSYKEPVIVTGCDGVGTKTEILFELDMVETAGKDLVAMNVNDILTTGGDPLLFLDYLGISIWNGNAPASPAWWPACATTWNPATASWPEGKRRKCPVWCRNPSWNSPASASAVVKKSKLIDPKTVRPGDVFIGYKSDSFHANGWSLIRRILEENPDVVDEEELRSLLQPTRLYHDVVADMRRFNVTPRRHTPISRGGLPENLERFLGDYGADLSIPYWDNTAAQKILKHVDPQDRFNTFNMGIGWVAIVRPEDAEAALKAGPGGTVIGTLREGRGIHVKVQGE